MGIVIHNIVHNPKKAAAKAGLLYVSDQEKGIQRRRKGKQFQYFSADGKEIHQPKVLARIATMVIPPAWKEVWICPQARGHIQATGLDDRGRKQYIYHKDWVELRPNEVRPRVSVWETTADSSPPNQSGSSPTWISQGKGTCHSCSASRNNLLPRRK